MKAWKPLIGELFLIVLYIIVDNINFPSKIGIKMCAVNLGFLSIVFDILIASTLFIITYYLIQEKELEKQENQKKIAKHLIRTCMRLCEDYISELDKPDITKMFFMANNEENPEVKDKLSYFTDYEELPFDYDKTITQFIISGVLSDKEMERYENAKNSYKAYVCAFRIYGNSEDDEKKRLMQNLKQKTLERIYKAK